ncbi:MAG TPA: CbiQ family ECF transporter T component [Actinomycetales bacterium]|nr:CbiQ family ECF transporter T component [Actinomycetales bacterium]
MAAVPAAQGRLTVRRALHPLAWWAWALGMATAASRSTNPLLIAVLVAVVTYVVAVRRGDAPWARAFPAYLVLGGVVVAVRMAFAAVLGAGSAGHELFRLPTANLPSWAAGIELGGPVLAEDLLAAGYDGLRLAALIVCVGAANALANPKRALRSLPPALYEVAATVVVALTIAPQLVDSVLRVRRARRLRGSNAKGFGALRAVVVPVLEDALSRALSLAAAMDVRGYGRQGETTARRRYGTSSLLLSAIVALALGVYALLDPTAPTMLAAVGVTGGLAFAAGGLVLAGRRVRRTTYRPDPWTTRETVVAATGFSCATVMFAISAYDPMLVHPSLVPLTWPSLPLVPLAAVLLGATPAVAAPEPPRSLVRRTPTHGVPA